MNILDLTHKRLLAVSSERSSTFQLDTHMTPARPALRSGLNRHHLTLDLTQTARFDFPAASSERPLNFSQLTPRHTRIMLGSLGLPPWTLESANKSLPTYTSKSDIPSLGTVESFWLVSFSLSLLSRAFSCYLFPFLSTMCSEVAAGEMC